MDNRSISHTRWKCQYHIVFIPKYRKKVLYGMILIVIGIILAALHFIVAGDGIRDFISSIIAVIAVLVILVGTYITLSEIKSFV